MTPKGGTEPSVHLGCTNTNENIHKMENNQNRRSCKIEKSRDCHRSKWRFDDGNCVLKTTQEVSSSSHSNVSSSHSYSPYLFHILVLVLLTISQCADGCSSRSTPKPRPPSHNSMRPNITFQTYACPPAYAAWYCLNGATCFTVKIADSILYNCECADGYMGQRCEFKDLNYSYQYLPSREKLLMGMGLVGSKSSRVGPVFLAVLIIIVAAAIVSFIVTKSRTRAKKARIIKQQSDTISNLNNSPSSSILMMQNSSMDMTVLGQSISYSLSQQRYPYFEEYQGAELRSIHRNEKRIHQ